MASFFLLRCCLLSSPHFRRLIRTASLCASPQYAGMFAPEAEWVVGGRPFASRGASPDGGVGKGSVGSLGSLGGLGVGGASQSYFVERPLAVAFDPLASPLGAYEGSVEGQAFNGLIDGLQVGMRVGLVHMRVGMRVGLVHMRVGMRVGLVHMRVGLVYIQIAPMQCPL
jgi:hypothetical protein